MGGTRLGGLKAAATNKRKHGADFYKVQGARGGKAGTTGGFYANRELASRVGRIGGQISRRGKAKKNLPEVTAKPSIIDRVLNVIRGGIA